MTTAERLKIQRLEEQYEESFSRMANRRLQKLGTWFAKKFPRHHLNILFGNGTYLVEIDGLYVDDDPWTFSSVSQKTHPSGIPTISARPVECLIPLHDAIQDVLEITETFGRGCPDCLTIGNPRTLPLKRNVTP